MATHKMLGIVINTTKKDQEQIHVNCFLKYLLSWLRQFIPQTIKSRNKRRYKKESEDTFRLEPLDLVKIADTKLRYLFAR